MAYELLLVVAVLVVPLKLDVLIPLLWIGYLATVSVAPLTRLADNPVVKGHGRLIDPFPLLGEAVETDPVAFTRRKILLNLCLFFLAVDEGETSAPLLTSVFGL